MSMDEFNMKWRESDEEADFEEEDILDTIKDIQVLQSFIPHDWDNSWGALPNKKVATLASECIQELRKGNTNLEKYF